MGNTHSTKTLREADGIMQDPQKLRQATAEAAEKRRLQAELDQSTSLPGRHLTQRERIWEETETLDLTKKDDTDDYDDDWDVIDATDVPEVTAAVQLNPLDASIVAMIHAPAWENWSGDVARSQPSYVVLCRDITTGAPPL